MLRAHVHRELTTDHQSDMDVASSGSLLLVHVQPTPSTVQRAKVWLGGNESARGGYEGVKKVVGDVVIEVV